MHLIPSKMKSGEYVRNVFRVTASHDQDIDFFRPASAWAHVAEQLKRGDKVEIFSEDHTWYAEGIVTSVKIAAAKIEFYLIKIFDDPGVADSGDAKPFFTKHRGRAGWSVIRRSDGEVMESGLQTKGEAETKSEELNADGD